MKKKKTITKCPDYGSICLLFKPDGTILCIVCMGVMDKNGQIIKPGRKAKN